MWLWRCSAAPTPTLPVGGRRSAGRPEPLGSLLIWRCTGGLPFTRAHPHRRTGDLAIPPANSLTKPMRCAYNTGMEQQQERTYTPSDVARMCDVTEATVRRWCRLGYLPGSVKTGGKFRGDWSIPASALDGFVPPKPGRPPGGKRK
jgi:hypothetical protein